MGAGKDKVHSDVDQPVSVMAAARLDVDILLLTGHFDIVSTYSYWEEC